VRGERAVIDPCLRERERGERERDETRGKWSTHDRYCRYKQGEFTKSAFGTLLWKAPFGAVNVGVAWNLVKWPAADAAPPIFH
jgi:hypothetical protein